MSTPSISASRILILAPHGRDAAVAAALAQETGAASAVCADLADFQASLGDDVCFAVVTEESLRSGDLRAAVAWVEAQPSWSDLPFIVLTLRGGGPETLRGGGPERNPSAIRLAEALGNVTYLERPFHPTTFVSVARTAYKGRLRQYEARARIEELHEGEERLRTALRAGRLGTWELDLSAWILAASETCKAVFGRGVDEPFVFEDLIGAIHPEDRTRALATVKFSATSGTECATEFRATWPDGDVHWVEIRARIVHDRVRSRPRLVGVASDITGRKIAEVGLRNLNETLEERVAERTHELERAHAAMLEEIGQRERAEEQLRQAQKMEIIGQLTGGIAHDFNNLLMVILVNLDLLGKHVPSDARSTRLIDGAQQAARRGAALTQRLLAFARRQELQVEPTSIPGLVRGMADLLQRSVGAHVDLKTELADAIPFALVDANQLELAVLNLVINARDAMPAGGTVVIAVDSAQAGPTGDLPAGTYVRVAVTDTGHGMDAETLGKATEPFFSTKELGKGTGLGLSMVYGLAVQLNGTLRLSSEVGQGTRAELWLPATSLTAEAPPRESSKESYEAASKVTVLIVDDDPLITMSTADMLADLGHEVIEADSGAEALEILQEGRKVDLLITDYSMPRMTGAQLAAAARELRPGLPILLATGFAELPKGSGIDLPRLGKPYLQDQLAAEISKVLRSPSG